jgi:hypothetical protein
MARFSLLFENKKRIKMKKILLTFGIAFAVLTVNAQDNKVKSNNSCGISNTSEHSRHQI